jgi:CRISPR system Cascade subunit CasE
MYLSRLILNPRSRQVRNELADPYELHRTINKAFPDANFKDNEPSGILFRVDLHPRTHIPTLLVQSRQKPAWDVLLAEKKNYLLEENDLPLGVENPAVKEMSLQLREGQVLAFRLRANPTKRIKENEKRVGLIREEDQHHWLKRKLEFAGAALVSVNILNDQFVHGKLFIEQEKEKRISLLSVQFDGLLQVKNPEELVKTIYSGFGSAKGLGFGLLSLARAQ